MKRNKANIGKRVLIRGAGIFNGRTGIVKGFRGDWGQDPNGGRPIPYVQVLVAGMIYPFRGCDLIIQKNERPNQ